MHSAFGDDETFILASTDDPLRQASCSGNINYTREKTLGPGVIDPDAPADETLLHTAVSSQGRMTVVHQLLDAGSDCTAVDARGLSALHLAARNARIDTLRLLIERITSEDTLQKPDSVINTRTRTGLTALHFAARSYETTELLCRSGADPRLQDERGDTPLHCLAADRDADVASAADVLVKHGADVNARNASGKTPLHCACIRLRSSVVDGLLRNGADCNAGDVYGATPLLYAVLYQTFGAEFSQVLAADDGATAEDTDIQLRSLVKARRGELDNGERIALAFHLVDRVDGYGEWSADECRLDYVICRMASLYCDDADATPGDVEHVRVVQTLLSNGANVNEQDRAGRSPLHIASSLGYLEIAKLLIANNACIHVTDAYDCSPLHDAARNGHRELVSLLLGVHMNIRNNGCIRGTCTHRLPKGSFVNWKDARVGETALHKAVGGGRSQIVDVLIRHGADLEATTSLGLSPLHIAVRNRRWDVAKLLMKAGAKCNSRDVFGSTPLHYAVTFVVDDRGAVSCAAERLQLVRTMLEHGADGNSQTTSSRRTPLHAACITIDWFALDGRLEFIDLLNLLLDATNRQLTDVAGNTCVHSICEHRLDDRVLAGRPVDCKNMYGLTPFIARFKQLRLQAPAISFLPNVVDRGDADTADMTSPYIKYVVDSAGVDVFGRNVLHFLLSKYDLGSAVTKTLDIVNVSEVHATDFLGRTCLHHLCIMACSGIVCHLRQFETFRLRLREVVNTTDVFGRTALFYAALHCAGEEVMSFLFEIRADGTIADDDNVLPGDIAVDMGFEESILPRSLRMSQPVTIVDGVEVVSRSQRDDPREYQVLRIKSDSYTVWRTLQSSRNGEDFSLLLKNSVFAFVERLLAKVASIDSRFFGLAKLVGSSNEDVASKPRQDEYDFLVALPMFERCFEAAVEQDCPMSVRFRLLEKRDSGEYREFCNPQSTLLPHLLVARLRDLVVEATGSNDLWTDGVFEYLYTTVRHRDMSASIQLTLRPNRLRHGTTAYVLRRGTLSKRSMMLFCESSSISLDLVPSLRTTAYTLAKPVVDYIVAEHIDVPVEAFAIMKSPKCVRVQRADEQLSTVSFGTVESEIVRRSSESIRAAYALLKSSMFAYVSGDTSRQYTVTKYALKTCLLHCIVNRKFSVVDADRPTSETILNCINVILWRLCEVVVEDAVPYVTSKTRQTFPVWRFESASYFDKWFMQRLGIRYSEIVSTPGSKFGGCCGAEVLSGDSVLMPSKMREQIVKMQTTFGLFHDFCHELSSSQAPEHCHIRQFADRAINDDSSPSVSLIHDVDTDIAVGSGERSTTDRNVVDTYCVANHCENNQVISVKSLANLIATVDMS